MKLFLQLFFLIIIFTSVSCSNQDNLTQLQEGEKCLSHLIIERGDTTSTLSAEGALIIASNYQPQGQSRSLDRHVSSLETINDSIGNPVIYIINYADNNGYLILSAAKSYFPVMAESEYGNLSLESLPLSHPVYGWLQKEKSNIMVSSELPKEIRKAIDSQWATYSFEKYQISPESRGDINEKPSVYYDSLRMWSTDPNIQVYRYEDYIQTNEYANLDAQTKTNILSSLYYCGNGNYGTIESSSIVLRREIHTYTRTELLNTQWHQGSPYNQCAPPGKVLGCTTIAAGQIMKFHQFPSSIRWKDIPEKGATSTTGQFLYHLAKHIGINFSGDNQGATISQVKDCLKRYGYNVTEKGHNPDEVFSEVYRGFPVYMRGEDKSNDGGKHAWVCDGILFGNQDVELRFMTIDYRPTTYSTPDLMVEAYNHLQGIAYIPKRFHYNWGWGGNGNGFFLDSDITVTLSSGKSHNYKHSRKNLFIRPQ